MTVIKDRRTGFIIGDPAAVPFPNQQHSADEIQKALKPMILSISGWRKIFAADGDEESVRPEITTVDKELSATAAEVFSTFLKESTGKDTPTVLLSLDARFTGPTIGDVMCRTFLAEGLQVIYTFITAAPEAMAFARAHDTIDGFAYVSASHNPIGHNGIKFGLKSGGVLNAAEARNLISLFTNALAAPGHSEALIRKVNDVAAEDIAAIYTAVNDHKKQSALMYSSFSETVITGFSNSAERQGMLYALKNAVALKPIGVVAELNGSARTLSIDSEFMKSLGIAVNVVNGVPRQIVHRIVPEGISLNQCKEEIEKLHAEDTRYTLGYVPDNDGDRGNIVFFNDHTNHAEIIQAQEVFALTLVSELAYLVFSNHVTYDADGNPEQKVGVVVNGPTSMRVDIIAQAFGVKVFRSEVGEANVVRCAENKRAEGYIIRIMGEGSNGGNITYPAAVRDPLNTIFAFIKLLSLTSIEGKQGLFEIWCKRSGQNKNYRNDFSMADIIATLPSFVTTNAYEPEAITSIRTADHAKLKAAYELIFPKHWEQRKTDLHTQFGIVRWEEVNYEGNEAKTGVGTAYRTGDQKGGLKIIFYNDADKPVAFIWMRGSGTEPVFRILADVASQDNSAQEYFLHWQTQLVQEADTLAAE